MSDNIQAKLNDVVARNWHPSTASPDQAQSRAQAQAASIEAEQVRLGQEQPPSWEAQQAAERQQVAQEVADMQQVAARQAKQRQLTNYQQSSSAKAPPAQPPSVQQAINAFYGKGKKGGK